MIVPPWFYDLPLDIYGPWTPIYILILEDF